MPGDLIPLGQPCPGLGTDHSLHGLEAQALSQPTRVATPDEIEDALQDKGFPDFFGCFGRTSEENQDRYWGSFGLLTATFWNTFVPFLVAMAAWATPSRYGEIRDELRNETYILANQTYYVTEQRNETIKNDAIALSMTALDIAGVRVTTTYFVFLVPLVATFFFYYWWHVQFREKKQNIVKEDGAINFDAIKSMSRNAAKKLLRDAEITVAELTEIPEYTPSTKAEKFSRNLADFASNTASKWGTRGAIAGALGGTIWMLAKYYEPDDGIECSDFPLYALLMNTCPEARKTILFLMGSVWFGGIGTSLVAFSASILTYYAHLISPNCFPSYSKKDDAKQTENFLYTKLLFALGLTIFTLPYLLTFALPQALDAANTLGTENYCGNSANSTTPFNDVLHRIFSMNYPGQFNDQHPDNVCNSLIHANVLQLFLSEFEIAKTYPYLTGLGVLALFAGGALDIKQFCKKLSALTTVGLSAAGNLNIKSHLPKINLNEAQLAKTREIYDYIRRRAGFATQFMFLGLVLGGIVAFFPALKLSSLIPRHGEYEPIAILPPPMPPTNVLIHPQCNHTSVAIYFHNLLGTGPVCSPTLEIFAEAAFVAVYWLCTTTGAFSLFSTVFAGQMLWDAIKLGLNKAGYCLEKKSDERINDIEDLANHQAQRSQPKEPKPFSCCLWNQNRLKGTVHEKLVSRTGSLNGYGSTR